MAKRNKRDHEIYNMKKRLLLSQSYFIAFKILMNQIIEKKDKFVNITDDEDNKEILEINMFMLAQPVLFCFYQGLELLLKGFVLYKNEKLKFCHDTSKLYIKFKELYVFNQEGKNLWGIKGIDKIFRRYLINFNIPFIKKYISANNFDNIKFYNSLRYPDIEKRIVNYMAIQMPKRKTISEEVREIRDGKKIYTSLYYYQKMIDDGDLLYKKCVALFRKLEDEYEE